MSCRNLDQLLHQARKNFSQLLGIYSTSFKHHLKKDKFKYFCLSVNTIRKALNCCILLISTHTMQCRKILFARCDMYIPFRVKVTLSRFISYIYVLCNFPSRPRPSVHVHDHHRDFFRLLVTLSFIRPNDFGSLLLFHSFQIWSIAFDMIFIAIKSAISSNCCFFFFS